MLRFKPLSHFTYISLLYDNDTPITILTNNNLMTKKKVKVILHKTINPSMQKGDLIETAYGYARNYLLPNRIAFLATKNMIKQFSEQTEMQTQKISKQYNEQSTLKNYLEKIQKFSVRRKTNQHYKFFGSITHKDISQLIKYSTGNTIDKKHVKVPQIRQAGYYPVQIKLLDNIEANLWIQVLPLFIEIQ